MNIGEQLKKDFSTMTVALIPVAIVVNMVVRQMASAVKLPVFLDSIGTILVGILAGPWAGLATGIMTNLIWGLISSPVAAAFAPVAGVIGLVAGLCAKTGLFQSWWKAILAGVLIGVAASCTAVPIRVYMFGGVTGSGADFLTAYLLRTGQDLFGSVIITVMTTNIPDKIASALMAWGIVRALPQRFRFRFPRAQHVATAER